MNPLNASQVHILKALVGAPYGLSRAELQKALGEGISLSADNLGPVTDDPLDRGSNPNSLRARGMIEVADHENEPPSFYITAKGSQWAKRSSAKSKTPDSQKIPNKVLDAAVKTVRANKSYGLELFTPGDIDEVRSHCAALEMAEGNGDNMEAVVDKYAAIDDYYISLQMTNRRKLGAFADPEAKVRANLVKLAKLLREFNVQISEESEENLNELCDNHDLPPILEVD